MSDDLDRLFAGARRDADAVVLAEPAALRRTGTRRTRMRTGVAAALVLIALATTGVAVTRYTAAQTPPVIGPPGPSASVAPTSPSPSPSSPFTRFTEDPCTADVGRCRPPERVWSEEKLPAPCTPMVHPSDTLVVERRSRTVFPDAARPGLAFGQTFVRYTGDGASRYVAEVEEALGRCSSVRRTTPSGAVTLRYRKVASGAYNADVTSLVLTRSHTSGGREITFRIMVSRFDKVVVVVYDHGDQGRPTPQEAFEAYGQQSAMEGAAW